MTLQAGYSKVIEIAGTEGQVRHDLISDRVWLVDYGCGGKMSPKLEEQAALIMIEELTQTEGAQWVIFLPNFQVIGSKLNWRQKELAVIAENMRQGGFILVTNPLLQRFEGILKFFAQAITSKGVTFQTAASLEEAQELALYASQNQ